MKNTIPVIFIFVMILNNYSCKPVTYADIILINGKVVTVNNNFTIAEALAISADTILAVGTTDLILKLSGDKTRKIDLEGKTVIPGLIDSHLHPESASISELYDEIPDVKTINQLLDWIRNQVSKKPNGEWIIMPKFFSTRLIEMRQPDLDELDQAAPSNPVFLNGSFGGMINSAAMKLSDITSKTDHPGIIKDRNTGSPTGFIRASAFKLLKLPVERELSKHETQAALSEMLQRYNRYGITSLFSGAGDFESVRIYKEMSEKKTLTARIYQNILLTPTGSISKESVTDILRKYESITGSGDKWVRISSLKVFIDGGLLTGTAYLQEPWGEKAGKIFGIEDSSYRGIVNYSRKELFDIISVANEFNWSFTAHATGDGSVNLLLDVFKEADQVKSIKERRFSIIHGNFFNKEAIAEMKELGVCANIQPAWFYKDADAMVSILGNKRVESFHPNKSLADAGVIVNGGSDHMVKWDANASINPYNPFLAMWTMITRKTEQGSVIGVSEAVSREEALKIYTINNAYASFEESLKGSIEPGKLADIVVLSDDYLECPVDDIKDIEALITIVDGKIVYSKMNVP